MDGPSERRLGGGRGVSRQLRGGDPKAREQGGAQEARQEVQGQDQVTARLRPCG